MKTRYVPVSAPNAGSPIRRAALFYFSGTGNTGKVAADLSEALWERGVPVDCLRIDACVRSGTVPELSGYDAVIIGYPVYAFNVPSAVAAFIRMMPAHMPLYVFKTAGEPFRFNRPSSFYIAARLGRMGYDLRYERLFLMPYNILFRYSDEIVKQIVTLSQKLAVHMAGDIAAGASCRPRFDPIPVLISLIFRIQWPGAALNGRLQRVTSVCSLCGKCVRECPTGNIRIQNGKIRFGWKCSMCMRCVMYCPQQAIRAGLLEHWAVRGAYDFSRILSDPSIRGDVIQTCRSGIFRHFKPYVRQTEALTASSTGKKQPAPRR